MATIKDLAAATGLSVATVSKYLNGGNVMPENRAALEAAVRESGYRTNTLAKALKTRCSMTVGVLIPRFNNVFYSTLVSELETELSQRGYSTIVCAYHDDAELELQKLDFLINKSVDGIIMTPLGAASRCPKLLRELDKPVVMVDRACAGISCDMVLSDNYNAAAEAVRYLARHGHRKIGIVAGPEGVYTADERMAGYQAAITELELENSPSLIRRGNYSIDSGNRCLLEFLDMAERPTGVIITNYEMTIGGVIALESRKIAVPEELSLIGFDNLELAQVIKPPLTMVVQQTEAMARASVEMLLRRLANPSDKSFSTKKFPTELVVRESIKTIKA